MSFLKATTVFLPAAVLLSQALVLQASSSDPCKKGRAMYYPYMKDCTKFYQCVHNRGVVMSCPDGLVWNQKILTCARPPKDNSCRVGWKAIPVKPGSGNCGKIVCYFTNWAQYRKGIGMLKVHHLDANHCTHLIFAFAKLRGNKLAPTQWNDESTFWRKGSFDQFTDLKQKNPSLKTLLSVGGWSMGSAPFTAMVASAENRTEFISNSIPYLRAYKFDGLDIHWTYPGNRGSPPGDKQRFTLLLKETMAAFKAEALRPGQKRLLLTAAVAAGYRTIDAAYEIGEIGKYLDFMNLLSYSFHGHWDSVTGHNSALGEVTARYPFQDKHLNVKWAADYYIKNGFPRSKLIIGVPFFGRSFTLARTSNNGLGAITKGPGEAGAYTKSAGTLSFYEVCGYHAQGPTPVRFWEHRVPYLTIGDTWISYDDPYSVGEKARYVIKEKFGGVMVWSLSMDDRTGKRCGVGPWPLMNAVKNACFN